MQTQRLSLFPGDVVIISAGLDSKNAEFLDQMNFHCEKTNSLSLQKEPVVRYTQHKNSSAGVASIFSGWKTDRNEIKINHASVHRPTPQVAPQVAPQPIEITNALVSTSSLAHTAPVPSQMQLAMSHLTPLPSVASTNAMSSSSTSPPQTECAKPQGISHVATTSMSTKHPIPNPNPPSHIGVTGISHETLAALGRTVEGFPLQKKRAAVTAAELDARYALRLEKARNRRLQRDQQRRLDFDYARVASTRERADSSVRFFYNAPPFAAYGHTNEQRMTHNVTPIALPNHPTKVPEVYPAALMAAQHKGILLKAASPAPLTGLVHSSKPDSSNNFNSTVAKLQQESLRPRTSQETQHERFLRTAVSC